MNTLGSDVMAKMQPNTLLSRFNGLRERYRVHISTTLAILAALTFIAAQYVPAIQAFILSSGLLQYVILALIADLAISVHLQQRQPPIRVVCNQDEAMPILIESLPDCRGDSVDLLEYAGATTLPLIRAIVRAGIPMRMLAKHPETVEGMQKHRMITTLDTLYNSVVDDAITHFEIRCYRQPYTLRARRLGNVVLELGWLTPDLKRKTAYGHANPSLVADLATRQSTHLRLFFDRTFSALWNATDTEDGLAVLNRLGPSARAPTKDGQAPALPEPQ